MDRVHVLLLALLQGATELFPVSSLGHTVVIPGLLGWQETLHSPTFLPLLVALHLGTAIALLTFFWRDWRDLLAGGVRVLVAGRFTPDVDPRGHGRELALVVVGTLPAGLLGLLFQKPLERVFGSPLAASAFLVLNGGILLLGERVWRRERAPAGAAPGTPVGEIGGKARDLRFGQAALIGLAQAGALLPGFSRAGLTIVAGLANGLSHEASARFSFLLATPLICAAGLLELPQLVQAGGETLILALLGGALAGLAAWLSVRFLMRYLETHRLDVFGYYCLAVGLGGVLFFLVRGS